MFTTLQPLILASASPRRQRFLKDLGLSHAISTADIDETPYPDEKPAEFALRMAIAKATAVARTNPQSWVIGADTVVTLADGTILGKPASEEEALTMLRQLNNSTHRVMTGLCLCSLGNQIHEQLVETTEVTFADVAEEVLRAYIQTGEPLDKAGSYGIQGIGALLVRSVQGSFTNVVGLPLDRLLTLLRRHEIIRPVPE